MKKSLIFMIGILCLFMTTSTVSAAGFSTSISGPSSINAGSTFTVTLNVSGGTNLMGISFELNYDSSKLNYVSAIGTNDFVPLTVGSTWNNFVMNTGKSDNFSFAIFTFKAIAGFNAGETTIKLLNVTGSDGTDHAGTGSPSITITVNTPKSTNNTLSSLAVDGASVSGFSAATTSYDLGNTDKTSIVIAAAKADAKATISGVGTKALNYGKNTFAVKVTSESEVAKTYTLIITRNDTRSTNNYLSSLTLSAGSISFNKSTLAYTVIVENNVSSIQINGTAEDGKSTVSGIGSKNLEVYLNKFSVIVTAENGSTKTYLLMIARKDANGNAGNLSSNNKLATLTVEGYPLSFSADQESYNITVDNTISKVVVTATVADEKSLLSINNVEELKVGPNTITVDVTAENGDKKTYTLTVTRKNDSPVTTIDKVLDVLNTTTSATIIVEIKDGNNELSEEIINKIQETKKIVVVNKYDANNQLLYSWTIDGVNITNKVPVNTSIKFVSPNEIEIAKLTNYVDALYLNFEHSGNLPGNTKIKIYVGNKYEDGNKVNLYYYNSIQNKIEVVKKDIVVEGGYIEIEINHCSEYLVSMANLGTSSLNIFMIFSIIEGLAIASMLGYSLIKNKSVKKKELPPQIWGGL